jgi:hypothetical protein
MLDDPDVTKRVRTEVLRVITQREFDVKVGQ